MQLKDMLFPECTLIHVKADRKEDVIWKLYEKLLQNGKVKENFYEAVLEREREYPTGLKFEKWEVAIPHVSPEYVLESTIAIAVLDEPVEFKRMDDESSVHVNVVFNIALGKDGTNRDFAGYHGNFCRFRKNGTDCKSRITRTSYFNY